MIKVETVTRKYGDVVAVDNVSFEIKPREIVGLLGHNGAGKTTIMKMVTGYLEPTAGSITLDGLDSYQNRLLIQQKIGYLPENCPLYPDMTVIDYLDYAADLRGVGEAQKLDRMLYAIEKTKLESVMEKPIATLSRGYRQRLGVAQAILNQPTVLILDEPTNGLDPSQILEMRALIKELAQTATVVVSTHILQEVQAVCGRVVIIKEGKLALDSDINLLQTASRLIVAVDQAPEQVQPALAKCADLHVSSHVQKNEQHWYTLTGESEKIQSSTPQLVRELIGTGCQIYMVQPVMQDLETVFGEINSGRFRNNNNGSNKLSEPSLPEPSVTEASPVEPGGKPSVQREGTIDA